MRREGESQQPECLVSGIAPSSTALRSYVTIALPVSQAQRVHGAAACPCKTQRDRARRIWGGGAGINVQSMRPGDLGRIGNNTDGGRPVWPCNCASLYLKDVGSRVLGRTFLKPHVEFTFPRKTPQKEGTLEEDLCLVPGSSLGLSSFLLPSLATHSN